MTILDQDKLNIDSELDLFNALLRFANERGMCREESIQQQNGAQHQEKNASVSGIAAGLLSVEEIKMEPDVNAMVQGHDEHFNDGNGDSLVYPYNAPSPDVVVVDSSDASVADGSENEERAAVAASSYDQPSSSNAAAVAAANLNYFMEVQRSTIDENMLKKAVKKIRFLTMTPQQFAEGPARSKLLQEHEALAILIKISSPSINDCPMPEGFCNSRSCRNYYEQRSSQRDLSTFLHTHPQNNFFCGSVTANNFPSIDAPMVHIQPQILSSNRSSLVNNGHRTRDTAGVSLISGVGDSVDGATHDSRRSYCVRTVNPQFDYRNTSVTDCGLTFQVDTNIWITGNFFF